MTPAAVRMRRKSSHVSGCNGLELNEAVYAIESSPVLHTRAPLDISAGVISKGLN